jgi:hypothetical protein
MQTPDEFAKLYSRAERLRFVVVGTIAGAAAILAGRLWLFPGLHAFAASAPCRKVIGLPGEVVLGYGIFVALPVLAACVVALTMGRRGLRILRDGQAPALGEKVLRPTRIVRGRRATVAGYLHVFAVAPLVVMVLWGVGQASEWSRHSAQHSSAPCATDLQADRDDRVGSPLHPMQSGH